MRSREEIKELAKQAFAAQRGNSILAVFLVGLLTGGLSIVISIPSYMSSFATIFGTANLAQLTALTAVSSLLSFLTIPLMLITMVLTVNVCGVFIKVYYGQPITATEPYSEIKNNFGRKLGGMCWELLWIYLWMLAFLVPAIIVSVILVGALTASYSIYSTPLSVVFIPIIIIILACIPVMIKAISYSMTQYILAGNPNVKATDAIKLSIRMTNGHKGTIFVMWLSFIGWQILSGLTLGILGIVYVNPYMQASLAGLFVELRSLAVASGVIHPAELDGVGAYYPHQQQYPAASPYGQHPQHPPVPPYGQHPQHPPIPPHGQHPQYPPVPPHTQPSQQIPPPPQTAYYPQQPIQQPPIPQAPPIPEPKPPEPPPPPQE